jgi:hypothetical protein
VARKKKQNNGSTDANVSPRKKAASAPAKKQTARTIQRKQKRASVIVGPEGPSDEDIQLRAYFISERRHRLDLPGDASSDWIEAKRQLLSEAGPR